MKNTMILILCCMVFGACGSSPSVSKLPSPEKPADISRQGDTVAAHTLEKDKETKKLNPPSVDGPDKKSTWTRSGDPIDTSKFDREIAEAEQNLKSDINSAEKKNALSGAYYKRGVALTEARQYASAIGDYRAALQYNPSNEDAKKWIATIAGIYQSMNREIPPPGKEPKPLEYKKDSGLSKS